MVNLRRNLNRPLTWDEMDDNFIDLDSRIDSLRETSSQYAFESLADAQAFWENLTPEERAPLDNVTFAVMGDGDNDGYYVFDSTQPDGVKFGRKFDRRIQVESISQLRNYTGRPGEAVDVLGYYESGDGGGGLFYWDAVSVEDDNGGTVIEANGTANGRWKRRFEGAVNVKWFGAKGDGVNDDTSAVRSAESYCFTKSKALTGDFDICLLTEKIQFRCDVQGAGKLTFKNGIADTTTHDSLVDLSSNVKMNGVGFTGENVISRAINIPQGVNGVEITGCIFRHFNGSAIYDQGGSNYFESNTIDDCGHYSSPTQHAVYLQSGSIFKNNSVLNSKYKAIITGAGADSVQIIRNNVNKTFGDASVGIYASLNSKNILIAHNYITGTNLVAQSIKTSQGADNIKIIGNQADDSLLMQGSKNCKVIDNIFTNIGDLAHGSGGGIPSRNNLIKNNVCSIIKLGDNTFEDIDGAKVIDNECDEIIGRLSGNGLHIRNNDCKSISLVLNPEWSSDPETMVIIEDNTIQATDDYLQPVSVGGFDFSNQIGRLIFRNNNIFENRISVDAVKLLLIRNLEMVNNKSFGGRCGFRLERIKESLQCVNNHASRYEVNGFLLRDSGSSTYWQGDISDYVVDSNKGSFDLSIVGRRWMYRSEMYLANPPNDGNYYRVGERYYNSSPTPGSPLGWVCVANGSPGTWEPFGLIEA